jgi:hypothetical protein
MLLSGLLSASFLHIVLACTCDFFATGNDHDHGWEMALGFWDWQHAAAHDLLRKGAVWLMSTQRLCTLSQAQHNEHRKSIQ